MLGLSMVCLRIGRIRTSTQPPQANGICERFHKTMLNECDRVAVRKKIYRTRAALQAGLDGWMEAYNQPHPHQCRWC